MYLSHISNGDSNTRRLELGAETGSKRMFLLFRVINLPPRVLVEQLSRRDGAQEKERCAEGDPLSLSKQMVVSKGSTSLR